MDRIFAFVTHEDAEAYVQSKLRDTKQMMRIQVHQSEVECTLRVEGEIEGLAANELESYWRKMVCHGSAQVILDVGNVMRIDRKARSLLRIMHESGVRFTGAGMAIQDIIDEITAPSPPI